MIIDAYPLSALQAGMLYHSELDGVTFHDHTTLTLRGTFDEAALVRALDELSARHEVLRTSFDLTGFSEPVQLVHDRAEIPLTVSDGEPEYGAFDWTQAPLLRVHVRSEAGRFALTVYFHHAILDGWSVATLVSELLARYATPGLPVEPPRARFRDLVAAEKAMLARPEAAEFWREAIAEAPEGRLPRMPGYPTGGPPKVEVLATALPGDLAEALAEEAAAARVPLRSVLLAAHVRVMALLTGDPDVLTGTLTHSRPESEAGDEVLGLFLNTVPLRVRADAPELVQRVFQAEVAALPYRHFPLFEIQRASGRARLLDTHVDFRDFHVDGGAATPIEGQDFFEQTDFAFSAAFVRTPGQGLTLTISYDTTQFPTDQIAAIRDHYLRALSGNIGISPQNAGLLALWNSTARDHPGGMLHELVFEQAERTPEATALVFEGDRLTYRELAERARDVASGLDVRVDQPVGVCMERGLDLPVVLLGVLAAGGAYLPLDPADPEERRRGMLADAGAEIVLTAAGSGGCFTPPPVHEDNLAYVIFTSGSTGRPKGVGVSHRAIVNRLRWMQDTFQLTPEDRVLHKTPTTFDVSVWELFWPLITGATMVIARPGGHRDTAYLRDLIKTEDITTAHFVPSMLQAFLEEEDIQPPPRIICSGEALPPGLDLPGLHNLYGPTEAAVDVSWHPCQPGETVVPIGRPIHNTTLHVLDRHLREVPVGTPGELYIGGVQLARGYLGKPALTAERFLPAPNGQRLYKTGDLARWLPTAELEYLGRTDHQVKIRGMRVEPGEVEAALRAQPGVRDAAVTAYEHSLVGYIVGDVPDLRDILPDHMIPRRWVHLDALPLTRSGKLDRAALPPPETASARPYVPPRDEVEARLATLYEEVLKVPAAGILDDFFELGGHSLSALRLAARIRQELGRSLPAATVLAAPTISALARVLRQPEDLAPPSHVVPLNPDGDRTPIFFIHALGGQVFRYHPLARRLGPDQPVYAIAARGLVPGEEPHATLAEMADAYVADLLEVRPAGPYVLGGFCIGGNIALEVARRLRERGEQVPLVVLFYADAEEPVASASLEDDTVLLFHALAGGPEETLGLDAAELAARSPEERLLAVMSAASAADRLAPDTAEVEQARRYLAVFRANAHAVGGYRHEPYDGDVALFAPKREDGSWPSVAKGRFAHVPIPEERVPILYEPLVAGAAAEIRKWMDHGIPDQ
ncbi:non-ribosomal peptide synthetase [Nonomuraea basaltis]|uniref:non-ribosomal peptide synthetase n=1 Tax=Nonomuraea basaltis TaxID=2495887 RepID=UPI00110C4E26|nr:non-ribosomal peptide synthetase [Nonomuraea basaltis]TMR92803.1 amino acid adenylation domain-containing protein [Nonomuraea basaltis]